MKTLTADQATYLVLGTLVAAIVSGALGQSVKGILFLVALATLELVYVMIGHRRERARAQVPSPPQQQMYPH